MRGLRARGGVEVDLTWREGKLTAIGLTSKTDQTVKLRLSGKVTELPLKAGEPKSIVTGKIGL